MAETKKPLMELIYEDLVNAVSGIAKKTFFDRPNTSSEELTSFIVVELPTEIHGVVKGGFDFSSKCFGLFSVFCKSKKDGTPNIGAQSSLSQSVLDKFPINGKYITATDPAELMKGSDGNGYQVTEISFRLRTKFNARELNH